MPGARVKIENFSGEIPRVSSRLLPPSGADIAKNVKLYSGELRGIRGLKFLQNVPSALKVYRLPDDAGVDGYTWVGFDSLDVTLFRGPLLNDLYDRYYKFGDGAPEYNTLERIRNDDPWFLLGIPQPTGNGTLTPSGGSGSAETRFYVYTFVSAYGEEGPPSTPVTADGLDDDTWTLSSMDTTVPDASQRNITTKRIYRTVPGYSVTEFFYVADVALATSSYDDTEANEVVSRNAILESEQWFAPDEDIESAEVMPNGFFVAWSGRNVYFSESYRPHAWPPPYDLSTEYNVLGAGVFGQSIGLVTDGNPYIGSGASPESVTLTKSSTVEPGLSKNGIVTMSYGVLYPSQNGLVLLNANGPDLVTRQLLTKSEWLNNYSPETLIAAQYQTAYVAFYDADNGLLIDPMNPQQSFVGLDKFRNVDGVQTDPFTGDVFIVKNGSVYEWDAIDQPREQYQWKSKSFVFPTPCNIGAITFDAASSSDSDAADEESEATAAATAWNAARFAAGPLDFLGNVAIGLASNFTLAPPNDMYKTQNQQPIGGSPLIDLSALSASNDVLLLNVYADGELVYSEFWDEQDCIRLPSGFKAKTWCFEVYGRRNLYSIKAAETCRGLADV